MYANAKALHELLQEARAENSLLTMRLNAEHLVRQNVERENARLRDELDFCLKHAPKCEECEAMFNCEDCEAMLDCDECLRADASQKERKRLDYENDSLRELVRDMAAEIRGLGIDFARVGWCDYADRMSELGVEV